MSGSPINGLEGHKLFWGIYLEKKRLFSSLNKPNIVLRFFFPNEYLAVILQLEATFPL